MAGAARLIDLTSDLAADDLAEVEALAEGLGELMACAVRLLVNRQRLTKGRDIPETVLPGPNLFDPAARPSMLAALPGLRDAAEQSTGGDSDVL